MIRTAPALVVATALLLTACSATKIAYNKLDWLVAWHVDKYVELNGPSEALFDSGLKSLWSWHRRTQLSWYAGDLRELAEAAGQPMSPAQVESYLDRAQAHVDRIVAEAIPEAARVLAALDDEQVAGFLKRLAKARAKRKTEAAELTTDELREKSAERMKKSLKRWLGSITDEQKLRVSDWVETLRYEPAAESALSDIWAQAFSDVLASRKDPETADRLRRLLKEPPLDGADVVRDAQAHNRLSGIQFLSDLSRDLPARQRQHLAEELRQLAFDLEQLAAQPAE